MEAINRIIWEKYPDFEGVQPKNIGYTFIYEKIEITEDQVEFKRILRVTTDESGNILTISESK